MIIKREHIVHSSNPYVRKCCGCIHLRIGSSLSCLIWAGLSLYFAILAFQTKSPFYSYIDTPAALYIFGTISLILFGVSLGTLLSLYLRSDNGIRTASFMIYIVLFIFLVDLLINMILFIVKKSAYIQWCIQLAADLSIISGDFYHCDRMWQDELKFTILCTLLIMAFYSYWAFCLLSYTIKLRLNRQAATVQYYQQGMVPHLFPAMNNGDIIL
ncbi:hypothetical protein BY458DRAFT_458649 [Sporodiniella umbellata]|nr:hypothetical protein BY458DRAFT_458649 [Sporodiniella umbellata]